MLRALGTRPEDVFKLIVWETAYLSVLSILLGGAASLAGNYLLSIYGIVYPIPIEYGGFMLDRLVGKVSFQVFWIPDGDHHRYGGGRERFSGATRGESDAGEGDAELLKSKARGGLVTCDSRSRWGWEERRRDAIPV